MSVCCHCNWFEVVVVVAANKFSLCAFAYELSFMAKQTATQTQIRPSDRLQPNRAATNWPKLHSATKAKQYYRLHSNETICEPVETNRSQALVCQLERGSSFVTIALRTIANMFPSTGSCPVNSSSALVASSNSLVYPFTRANGLVSCGMLMSAAFVAMSAAIGSGTGILSRLK